MPDVALPNERRRLVVIAAVILLPCALGLGVLFDRQRSDPAQRAEQMISGASNRGNVAQNDVVSTAIDGHEDGQNGQEVAKTAFSLQLSTELATLGEAAPLSEPLKEMETLLESISGAPESAHILELRRRFESGYATDVSLERTSAMVLAIDSLRASVALTTLAACRGNVCEMQIAKRRGLESGAPGLVGEVIDAVDRELALHGMVRVSQTVAPNPKGVFSVTYWLPLDEVGRNLRR